jgi:pimeloyl-ACP methyl ester carboxylesterase
MENLRRYGSSPFSVVVVHGGPGAPGEMAPVARRLASLGGVLEPLQTATTLDGQVQELNEVLEKHGDPPLTMVGFSWGAMLSFITAARNPSLVAKLILVGSGPYEAKYAADIMNVRLGRLDQKEKAEALSLAETLNDPAARNKNALMARLGELIDGADSYDPLHHDSETMECRFDVYQSVWEQASRLRRSGELLRLGEKVRCPVLAIHGDYDPHPSEGVREPLSRIVKDFRFILLEECGHRPWIERSARDEFYSILQRELSPGCG